MGEPNDLGEFQLAFSRFLLSSDTHADVCLLQRLARWTVDDVSASRVNCGLRVYRNNVMYSLTEALAAQFPIVLKLVGPEFFRALASDYVRQQPPIEPALSNYGDQFAAFIAQSPECKSLAYLADVATLEWLCQEALHAADAPVLDVDWLATVPTEEVGSALFHLQPSAALMTSSYPVHEIWVTNLDDADEQIHLKQQHTDYLVVYRRGLQVQVVTLQPAAFALLQQLQLGKGLEHACISAIEQHALDIADLSPLLTYLLGLEIFSHVEPTPKETI